MVATSITTHSVQSLGLDNSPTASGINKCRYKTGKCTNVRSSKRNGQPHQLCLYHRDKANKIQRKFDRQKHMAALNGLSPMSEPAVSPAGSTYSTCSSDSTMSFSSITNNDLDIYTDTECWSPNSDANSGLCDNVWTDLPVAAASYLNEFSEMPLATGCHQSYLSSDEIDFLCSAILE
ncbi:hypothetical protein BBO99_00007786 [Phytophthora kernoviae]|uniref:Uncharacterized protein n=2 Tax=Phytophthora kernoviae TaxID=325452 RepID=A0A3R7JD29_9STRA|nr:hypothetical protein G195_008890 [Phytophthora kernoviae 00238/432]KAG2519911.1 hypothetical protein JM18_007279 [Phytophthora kernoviae]RLN37461.1 hypothetical protein BBI17_007727 [Phytophthora kernoviae]RLN76136.1 hypothetical protein BBO99_00007786 [Phytophthora kernoviae]